MTFAPGDNVWIVFEGQDHMGTVLKDEGRGWIRLEMLTDIIDTIAEKLRVTECIEGYGDGRPPEQIWRATHESDKNVYRSMAKSALTALRDAGYTVMKLPHPDEAIRAAVLHYGDLLPAITASLFAEADAAKADQ